MSDDSPDGEPIRTLDYHTPTKRPSLFDRWVSIEARLYIFGVALGVAVVFFWKNASARNLIEPAFNGMFAGVIVALTAMPFSSITAESVRQRIRPRDRVRRAAIVGLLIFYFPAFHFVACRFLALPDYGDVYARRMSPMHFLLPWIVIAAIVLKVFWNDRSLGQQPWHWVAAGMAMPLLVLAAFTGEEFLNTSATGESGSFAIDGSALGFVFLFYSLAKLALPFFAVGFVFEKLRASRAGDWTA